MYAMKEQKTFKSRDAVPLKAVPTVDALAMACAVASHLKVSFQRVLLVNLRFIGMVLL